MLNKLKKYALPIGLIGLGVFTLGVIALPDWTKWIVGIGLVAGGIFMLKR